jgi:hypothetical protein
MRDARPAPFAAFVEQWHRSSAAAGVVFRSAEERLFDGAKGDDASGR